jgi:hypothetical protein
MCAPTLASLAFGIAAPRGGAVSPSGRHFGMETTPTLASLAFGIAASRGGAVSPSGRPFGTDMNSQAIH